MWLDFVARNVCSIYVLNIRDALLEEGLPFKAYLDKLRGQGVKSEDFRGPSFMDGP